MTTDANDRLLDTLFERLQGRESLDVEFKRARAGLPNDLWPTVSAFANTHGGWILLGIHEEQGRAVVEGLSNPDARLQEFHTLLRNRQKINRPVCGPMDATIEHLDERPLLVIRVPAAPRRERPVYIGSNPYTGTYVRRHTGDYLCSEQEINRMIRNAQDGGVDSTILPHYGFADLDAASLARYRRRFQTNAAESPFNAYEDVEFLSAIGGFRRDRQTGEEGITVAGLLLFGTPEAIREWRKRHLIDYRLLPLDTSTSERWDDRVTWEGNLLGAFESLYPRLTENQPRPFRLDGGVRLDQGPVHVAMREALVNLLVHADYAETHASLVTRSPDGYLFRNPGSSRVPEDDLFTGGDRSDPRNPTLVSMFRHIGLADEGGSGIPKILQACRSLGLRPPSIDSGSERYEFSLQLRHAHLVSDEDRDWLHALGSGWTEAEQMALLLARHENSADNVRLRHRTGQHRADASRTLVGLRDREFLAMQREGRNFVYTLDPAARARSTSPEERVGSPGHLGLSSDSNGASPGGNAPSPGDSGVSPGDNARSSVSKGPEAGVALSRALWAELIAIAKPARAHRRIQPGEWDALLVALCSQAPLTLGELMEVLSRKEAQVRTALRRLLADGRIRYLYPDQPSHPKQRYVAGPKSIELSLPL